jgi:predicted nucleotide-binding protein
MPRINQGLLQVLQRKLGVGQARVYELIKQSANTNRVPRHIAALLVAADNKLSWQKYASAQDMLDMRGPTQSHVPVTIATPIAATASVPMSASRAKGKARRIAKTKENTVFVVHGRDSKLRDAMYEFLGALGLKPQEWGHAIRSVTRRGGNPYVNDAVNRIMEEAEAIVVLLTPDDEVRLKDQFCSTDERKTEGQLQDQARPNVIFETGIAIGAYHKKTVIVSVGKVKPFTDIGGMHILNMNGSDAARNEFSKRLEMVGCTINTDGDHWLRAGEFSPAVPKNKKRKIKR